MRPDYRVPRKAEQRKAFFFGALLIIQKSEERIRR